MLELPMAFVAGAAADGQADQMLILIDDGKVAPGVKIAGVEVGSDA